MYREMDPPAQKRIHGLRCAPDKVAPIWMTLLAWLTYLEGWSFRGAFSHLWSVSKCLHTSTNFVELWTDICNTWCNNKPGLNPTNNKNSVIGTENLVGYRGIIICGKRKFSWVVFGTIYFGSLCCKEMDLKTDYTLYFDVGNWDLNF